MSTPESSRAMPRSGLPREQGAAWIYGTGGLLFLFIPIVLFLFVRHPRPVGASLAAGVALMLGHRFLARPYIARVLPLKCVWCNRVLPRRSTRARGRSIWMPATGCWRCAAAPATSGRRAASLPSCTRRAGGCAPGPLTGLARLIHETGRDGYLPRLRLVLAAHPWATLRAAAALPEAASEGVPQLVPVAVPAVTLHRIRA